MITLVELINFRKVDFILNHRRVESLKTCADGASVHHSLKLFGSKYRVTKKWGITQCEQFVPFWKVLVTNFLSKLAQIPANF